MTTQYLDEADHLADEILVIDRGCTVATGTPAALKQSVGRDVLEIRVPTDSELDAAARALAGVDGVTVDGESRRVDLSITGGTRQSLDVLRHLEDQAVSISDFQLRRPTLDDAFLALTGSSAAERKASDR